MLLPDEIDVCKAASERRSKLVVSNVDIEREADFYNVRENRLKIYERDNYHCHYCKKQLTRFTATLDHITPVAAGGDNLQDPFNVVGRGDPLETASLLIAAAHLTPERAYHAISTAARRALGLEAVTITAGAPAELLAIRAANVREAIAGACEDRLVFHAGKLVARTTLTREMYG